MVNKLAAGRRAIFHFYVSLGDLDFPVRYVSQLLRLAFLRDNNRIDENELSKMSLPATGTAEATAAFVNFWLDGFQVSNHFCEALASSSPSEFQTEPFHAVI